MNKGKYIYGFTFQYREVKNSELKTDRFIINSNDKNAENACTIAMLQFLTRHNYYSGILTKINVIDC